MSMPGLLRRFLGVWSVGLLGVLVLALQPPPANLLEAAPELAALSPLALRATLLLNPLILLTLMSLAGALVAHRVGLGSRFAGTLRADAGRTSARWVVVAVATGLGVALLLSVADALLAPSLGEEWASVQRKVAEAPIGQAVVVGALYGGVAEEVMMRWGLMSLVLFALGRVSGLFSASRAGGDVAGVTPLLVWLAIVVAALAFAAGHLPALAQSLEPTAPVVARTLALNALAGAAYGWLFWRHGLEAAMLAHAATHGGFALVRLAF